MSDIIIKNVTKKYQDEVVLNRFSYAFIEGNIYMIMGPSGVGKTTLLRLMMGLEACDQGEVCAQQDFSAVFQENRLVEELTPLTNVKIAAGGKTEEQICEQLREILPDSAIYKKCSELSGGMKRRVAIVRAMMHDSCYIIMDEPFAGLDEVAKKMTIDYILRRRNQRTLIVVSHDELDAKSMGAQICLLTRE